MKIKWGALVVDGRGKLGGHVAAQNKGGSYLRTKVTPSNPQTVAQTSVRSIFASISQAWSGLTAAQIVAWNAAVEDWKKTNIFGDLKLPSGKALFQRLNQELVTVGEALLTLPPAKVDSPEAIVTAAQFDITNTTLTLTGVDPAGSFAIKLFSSGPVSNGTTFVKNLMRMVGYTAMGDNYVPLDGYNAYVAKFGAPVTGQKIYVGVKYVAESGQATQLQTLLATIVA